MWEQGLVSEVEKLITDGLLLGTTAQRAIGYAQVLSALAGNTTEAGAMEETIVATRQYVRRQETWFKRDQRIQWIREDVSRLKFIEERINS
jgi:tRNA dimethylallyltransferase